MGRREENKRQKRDALLAAARDAFRAKGFEGASIEQVAAAASVARGTFYLYFEDKTAIFDALMERWFAPVVQILDAVGEALDAAENPEAVQQVYGEMAAALAGEVLTHAGEVEIAFRESRQPGEAGQAVRRREGHILDQVTAFTARAADRGLITVRDPRLFSLVVFGAVERLVYGALQAEDLGDPLVVAQDLLGWFGRALHLPR